VKVNDRSALADYVNASFFACRRNRKATLVTSAIHASRRLERNIAITVPISGTNKIATYRLYSCRWSVFFLGRANADDRVVLIQDILLPQQSTAAKNVNVMIGTHNQLLLVQ